MVVRVLAKRRGRRGLVRTRRCLQEREPGRFTARAGNRHFWLLSSLRAHAKAPYKTDLLRKTRRPLKRPGRPGQGGQQPQAKQPLRFRLDGVVTCAFQMGGHGIEKVRANNAALLGNYFEPINWQLLIAGCHNQ